ncbi:MAG: hypothetical protein LLG37_10465 [Spirochaetia bacterium]|nr:hypothetical protein [Spirochaetia bacterium]
MFPQYIEELYEEKFGIKTPLNVRVLYKILSRADTDYQGLSKEAKSLILYSRGLTMLAKEQLRPGDAMLVEMFIPEGGSFRKIKACCGILNSEAAETAPGYFETDVEFLFLKETDREYIDKFLHDRNRAAG